MAVGACSDTNRENDMTHPSAMELHDLREEVARLRVIEAAAVACSEHPVWNDDQFYGLMTELQRALRGKVGAAAAVHEPVDADGQVVADKTPNG